MKPLDYIGGRKVLMCILFLSSSTFLVYKQMEFSAIQSFNTGTVVAIDWVGIAACLGAIATGVGALVWGNVKEHEAQKGGG